MHPILLKFPITLILFVAQHDGLADLNAAAGGGLDYTQLPNIAVTVSLLLTLCSCPWTRLAFSYSERKPPRCVRFALDVWLTAYLVDVLLRLLWLPLLELAYHSLQAAAGHTAVWARGGKRWWHVRLLQPGTVWLRREAMGWVRCALAATVVWVMLVVTGVLARAGDWYVRQFGRAPGDCGDRAGVGVDVLCGPVVAAPPPPAVLVPKTASATSTAAAPRRGRSRGRAGRSRTRSRQRV